MKAFLTLALSLGLNKGTGTIFRPSHAREIIMKHALTLALTLGLCAITTAADKVEPVGTWNVEYKIGDMARTATLTIKKDGDKLAGTMDWPDQKDAKLKDVKLKDKELSYSATRKFMDNEFALDFKVTIDGDKFKGKCTTEFGGQRQEFDLEGQRAKEKK